MIDAVLADRTFGELVARLESGKGPVTASGVWGSFAPVLAAAAARRLGRGLLYLTAHIDQADEIQDDLELAGAEGVEVLSAWEALPGEGAGGAEIAGERVRLCSMLVEGQRPVVVAPIQALMQPVPDARTLTEHTLQFRAGSRNTLIDSPDALVRWAVARRYSRLDLVESPGDVARRGAIVDLFPPGEAQPYRFEFIDDKIESIRRFDVGTQRSLERLDSLAITALPDRTGRPDAATTSMQGMNRDLWKRRIFLDMTGSSKCANSAWASAGQHGNEHGGRLVAVYPRGRTRPQRD